MNNQLIEAPTPQSETSAILAVIERVAMDPNADIGKLEKMLDMQERILNRNAAQAFSSAFARMQAELPEVGESGAIKVGNETRSKYALFEDINEAVKPVLQQHGFAISFRIKQEPGLIKITGVLRHEQGHFEETEIALPTDTSGSKNAVQAIGSSVSYGKRYTISALLNITTRGEDDDGHGTDAINPGQAAVLEGLLKETSADRVAFLKYFKVSDVRHIRLVDYKNARDSLKKKQTQKAKGGA